MWEWHWWTDELLNTVFTIFFILAMICVPIGIILFIVSPRFRKDFLVRLIPILVLVSYVLFIYIRREQTPPTPATGTPQVAPPALVGTPVPGPPVATFEPNPPPAVAWLARLGLAALGAGAAGAFAWLLWRWRRSSRTLEELAQEAEKTLEALEEGANVHDAVLRCYFEMSRVVQRERGLVRGDSVTPREFEKRLARAGLPEQDVKRLTRLFEGARYGSKPTGETQRLQAMASLRAIVEASRQPA